MKNRILLMSLLCVILFWSCKEDSPLNPVIIIEDPVVELITIKAEAKNGGVIDPKGETKLKKGSSINLTVKSDSSYSIKSITIDGKEMITDMYSFVKNYNFILEDISSNKNIIAEFIEDKKLLLTINLPFYFLGYDIIQNDSIVDYLRIRPDDPRYLDEYYFYLNGRTKGNNWTLNLDGSLTIGSRTYIIHSLTKDELILDDYSSNWGGTYNGKPCIYRDFYKRSLIL